MTWSEFVGLKWFGVVPFDGEILNLSDVALGKVDGKEKTETKGDQLA